jgi:transposase
MLYETYLWRNVKRNPLQTIEQHRRFLARIGFTVGREFIRRTFLRWKWSWKKPQKKQVQKYTPVNIEKYTRFVVGIRDLPLEKIKYLDESHFVARDSLRRRAVGEEGESVLIHSSANLDESYSLTLLTTPANDVLPVVSELRFESNSQFDFRNFISYCIEKNYLKAGDWLILDNCRIHFAVDSFDSLMTLLRAAEVRVAFLPAYSPELNPCELVFAFVKNQLRNDDLTSLPLSIRMTIALAKIDSAMLFRMYRNCIPF